jgi:ParB family chromosome partitioning protein
MVKRRGLPTSLKSRHENHFVEEISKMTRTNIIRNISIDKINANIMQPRKDFGQLEELSKSIKEKGIIEPILVRPINGNFEIIAGERRFRAAKLAGLNEIPCIEHDVADNEALELTIIENMQRKDLNIFESAYSLKSLSEIYGYTHEEIAQKIGKSRVTVSEQIRITDLPSDIVKKCIELNVSSKTFLLQLVKLDDKDEMHKALEKYNLNPFSRDELKKIREEKNGKNKDLLSSKNNKPIKFNFLSEDKAIKIGFNIKDKNINKEQIIQILTNLIDDIKNEKIKEFESKI